MNTFRMMLLGTVAIGVTGLAVDASAAEVTKTMKVSATVNRAVVFTDDGDNTYVKNVTNNTKGDRFRMVGEAKSKDLTIGAKLEFGVYRTNNSNSVDQQDNAGLDTGTIDDRNAFIYFSSKKYGKLSLGKLVTGSDGSAEVDLSGTKTAYYNGNMPNSGMYFLQANEKGGDVAGATGPDNSTNPRIKTVMSSFDGLGRADGVRYDSPKFQGFQVSGGAYEGGDADIALKYSGKIAGTKVAATAAYWNSESTSTSDTDGYTLTASALHSSGLNATVSYAKADSDVSTRSDPDNLFVRLGYQLKVFGAGKTSMSISYQETNDKKTDQNQFTAYGVAVVQKLDAYGTELYAALTNSDLERGTTNWEDITSGIVGAKVEF